MSFGWSRASRGCLVLVALFVGALAGGSWGSARAQDYPSKPVRFVVGSTPGGVVDIRARRFGVRLGELLEQPIVVENRPGASSTIAAEFVAKSPPDGYTLLFGGNTEVVVASALGMPLRYDPAKDLVPVAQFTLGYPVLVVYGALGPKTFPELIDWARANPDGLLCGTAGHGTGAHFFCEMLARSAGIRVRSVAYKGSGPMLLGAASGQIHIALGFLAEVDKQFIVPGKVIPLGALAPARLNRFPQVPTMAELGHPGFELLSWTGLFAPAGTSRDVIRRLNREIAKVVREPAFVSWLADTGSEVVTPSPEEFAEFTRVDFERWSRRSTDLGIRAEQ